MIGLVFYIYTVHQLKTNITLAQIAMKGAKVHGFSEQPTQRWQPLFIIHVERETSLSQHTPPVSTVLNSRYVELDESDCLQHVE